MSRTLACAMAAAALIAALPQAAPAAEAPPAAAAGVRPFAPAERAKALERIAALIEAKYVYKDKAAAIAAEVRGLKADPELAQARDRAIWAAVLTGRLGRHDRHFSVSWAAPDPGKPATAAAAPPSREQMDREMAGENYGFQEVKRLAGNIGYVRMNFFADFDRSLTGDKAPGARRAGEATLQFLANTDAVIFDLRQNGGGSPDMIDLLLSGFFGDKPVLLSRFYMRETDQKIDFTTFANYAGPRRPKVPVYVLVSGRTASAAEEFTYDVQTQKRGLIVGETTYGGANPGDRFDAGEGFQIFISTGAAINPITNTNWEAVGVKPDVTVPAAEAVDKAHALALEAVLQAKASTAPTEAGWALERIKAEQAGLRLTAEAQAAYVGQFGLRRVAIENGELIYRRDRSPPQRLVPLGNDAFALDGSPDARIRFERDANGKVVVLDIANTSGDAPSFARTAG